jgi:hypothetical protein
VSEPFERGRSLVEALEHSLRDNAVESKVRNDDFALALGVAGAAIDLAEVHGASEKSIHDLREIIYDLGKKL